MKNNNNYGVLFGKLINNPLMTRNRDGSRHVQLMIEVQGETVQIIPCQGFLPKTYNKLGPFMSIHKDDYIEIEYQLRNNKQGYCTIQIEKLNFGNILAKRKRIVDKINNKMVNEALQKAQQQEPTQETEIKKPGINIPNIGDEFDL